MLSEHAIVPLPLVRKYTGHLQLCIIFIRQCARNPFNLSHACIGIRDMRYMRHRCIPTTASIVVCCQCCPWRNGGSSKRWLTRIIWRTGFTRNLRHCLFRIARWISELLQRNIGISELIRTSYGTCRRWSRRLSTLVIIRVATRSIIRWIHIFIIWIKILLFPRDGNRLISHIIIHRWSVVWRLILWIL